MRSSWQKRSPLPKTSMLCEASAARHCNSFFMEQRNEGTPLSATQVQLVPSAVNAYASGTMSEDELVELFAPFVEQAYALLGLELFNLKLSPLIQSQPDSTNDVGTSYAKFVAEVSAQVKKDRQPWEL